MKNSLLLLCLLCVAHARAQYNVTFQLKSFPPYHAANHPVFVAGDFNGWRTDGTAFRFSNGSLSVKLPKGTYAYKFTRGNWQTGETNAMGVAAQNRSLTVERDTIIQVEINGWADHFPQQARRGTASKNVHIIDTAFYIPQLARYRRIWIYLPESYATSRKKYPVLYLHDGQNVFDETTAYAGEWGVDEALDTLGMQRSERIVVAIDHGGSTRLNEYAPFDMEKYGRGEGDAYVDFIVKTLKPYVQKQYRTKRCRKHQAIAGSSMGGLISFYALLKYPKGFGSAGVFSPAFWIAPQLKDAIAARGKRVRGNIYFYAGKEESESMVPDLMAVFGQMSRTSKAKMTMVIRTGGQHNEARWRQEFPLFYKWLMP